MQIGWVTRREAVCEGVAKAETQKSEGPVAGKGSRGRLLGERLEVEGVGVDPRLGH